MCALQIRLMFHSFVLPWLLRAKSLKLSLLKSGSLSRDFPKPKPPTGDISMTTTDTWCFVM
jgi:hypothetical protein